MATRTQTRTSSNLQLRPFKDLGGADHGWLNTKHHFSFAFYFDPQRMGWGDLRVWNDDTVKPGTGFDPHPHKNMEIISYVYQGAISHKDYHGNKGRTEAGNVQVMTAGTGVAHSEYNLEKGIDTKFFQIWIKPKRTGLEPHWGAREFPKGDRAGKFVVLASGFTEDQKEQSALPINTDSRVLGATLDKGQTTTYNLDTGRVAYLVPARGNVNVNGVIVNAHDGLAIRNTDILNFEALEDSEIVMVDTIQN